MSIKLLAIGNVLMGDDGVAIYLAEQLRYDLLRLGIEVILGETDIGFLLNQISDEDYLILLDATVQIPCGKICCLSLKEEYSNISGRLQHDISLLPLCRILYPNATGMVIGIGVAELGFRYGLSQQLIECLKSLRIELIKIIQKEMNTIERNA